MSDLGAYLREIEKFHFLTRDGELELAKRIEAGDGAAKKTLIEANLRLVVAVARRYKDRGPDLLSLIQEGNLGLIRAVDRYDWRAGFEFSTFATYFIRQAIQRGLRWEG